MKFNIITNINNGVGLQREYELMRTLLTGWGHEVRGVHFRDEIAGLELPPQAGTPWRAPTDVNLWLEVLVPKYIGAARANWIVPMAEWWFAGWDAQIPQMDKILCKTRDGERIFKDKIVGARHGVPDSVDNEGTPWRAPTVHFIGGKSRDLYDPTIQRQRKFLHVAGSSQTKNTDAVLAAWKDIKAPLVLISKRYHSALRNVECHERASDEELRVLMNECQFHIMPSAYEGYGHALREGLGCGAVMITTDAPPMNECGAPAELLIAPSSFEPRHAAQMARITAEGVQQAVTAALSSVEIARHSLAARNKFLSDAEAFERKFKALVEGAT